MGRGYMGFDPGQTTGYAFVFFNAVGEVTKTTFGEIVYDDEAYMTIALEIGSKHRVISKLAAAGYESELHVVVEDYIGYGKRDEYTPRVLKIAGYAYGHAYVNGIDAVFQVPQTRKPFEQDATRLWERHRMALDAKSPHVISALAHALARRWTLEKRRYGYNGERNDS